VLALRWACLPLQQHWLMLQRRRQRKYYHNQPPQLPSPSPATCTAPRHLPQGQHKEARLSGDADKLATWGDAGPPEPGARYYLFHDVATIIEGILATPEGPELHNLLGHLHHIAGASPASPPPQPSSKPLSLTLTLGVAYLRWALMWAACRGADVGSLQGG
jgi:hypothetical protein